MDTDTDRHPSHPTGSFVIPAVIDEKLHNGKPKYGNNIFKTAWNLLTNVYDGSRQKPMTIVHSKRYRSEAEDTVIEINGNFEDMGIPPRDDESSSMSSRPPSSILPEESSTSSTRVSNNALQMCPGSTDNNSPDNCDKTNSHTKMFTGGGENLSVGINALLEDNFNVISRSSHRTDVDVNSQLEKGNSHSHGRLKSRANGGSNQKQYIRLSEIFQDTIRGKHDDGTPHILSRTFLDSVNEQIRQVRSFDLPTKSTSNLTQVPSQTSVMNSVGATEPNENHSSNNLNINLTVSLAQVQRSSGTTIDVGKSTTVRINVPTGKSDNVTTRFTTDPPPKYPSSWSSVSAHSLENAVVTSVPLNASHAYLHENNLPSSTNVGTRKEETVTVNEEGDLPQNLDWSSYFTLANAVQFTGDSIMKVYEVAEDIVTNYMIPPDPNIMTEEEMNCHEDKIAISMMRLMGIPQQTRHSIYNEALQELQVIHDVSTGTIDVLQNVISWLCTGDTKAKDLFLEKTRILATMQSEVDPDSEVWKQWENDFLLFSETVSNIVKGSVAAAQKYATDENVAEASSELAVVNSEDFDYNKTLVYGASESYDDVNGEIPISDVDEKRSIDNSDYNSLPEEVQCTNKSDPSNPFLDINNNWTEQFLQNYSLRDENHDDQYENPFMVDENNNVITDSSYDQQSNKGNDKEFPQAITRKETPSAHDVFYEAEDTLFDFAEEVIMADENSHRPQIEDNQLIDFETVMKSLHNTEAEISNILAEDEPVAVQSRASTLTDKVNENFCGPLELSCSQEDIATFASQHTLETYSDSEATELEEIDVPKPKSINSRNCMGCKNRSGIPLMSRTSLSVHNTTIIDELKEEDSAGGDEVVIKPENAIKSYYDEDKDSNFSHEYFQYEGNENLDLSENDSAKYELVSESHNESETTTEDNRSESWLEASLNESKLQSELLALEEVAQVLYTNISPSLANGSATSLYSIEDTKVAPVKIPSKQRRSRIPRPKVSKTPSITENKENTNLSRYYEAWDSSQESDDTKSSNLPQQQKQHSDYCQEQDSTISLYPSSPLRNSCVSMDNPIANIKGVPPKSNNALFIKPSLSIKHTRNQSRSRTRPSLTQPNSRLIAQPMKAHPIPSMSLQRPRKQVQSDFQAASLSKPFDFKQDGCETWKKTIEAMANKQVPGTSTDSKNSSRNPSRGDSYVDLKYRHPHTSYRELLHTQRQAYSTVTSKSTTAQSKNMSYRNNY